MDDEPAILYSFRRQKNINVKMHKKREKKRDNLVTNF